MKPECMYELIEEVQMMIDGFRFRRRTYKCTTCSDTVLTLSQM